MPPNYYNSFMFIHNNINYCETIKVLKTYLNEIGCTHFFFSQDDTFSANNNNLISTPIDTGESNWQTLFNQYIANSCMSYPQ